VKWLKQLGEATGESLHAILDLSFAPVDLEGTTAFAALVRLLAHRIVHANGEQLATVRAVDLRRAGDGSREAEFVVDEVVRVERATMPEAAGLVNDATA
jgi:hypothetical protein